MFVSKSVLAAVGAATIVATAWPRRRLRHHRGAGQRQDRRLPARLQRPLPLRGLGRPLLLRRQAAGQQVERLRLGAWGYSYDWEKGCISGGPSTCVVTSRPGHGRESGEQPRVPPSSGRHQLAGVRLGRRATVAAGEADYAVLMCWTATGTSIAANKVPGVRAALAWKRGSPATLAFGTTPTSWP